MEAITVLGYASVGILGALGLMKVAAFLEELAELLMKCALLALLVAALVVIF